MLPREKLSAGLIFAGIALTIAGIAATSPGRKQLDLTQPASPRTGAWRAGGISSPNAQEASPWIISAGLGMFVAAYFARPR